MKTVQKPYFRNSCGVLFLGLGILSFFICLFQAFGQDIWYDEVFSVNFIKHSYGEIAALTAKDVHPPLYYWYLKLFHDVGKTLVPGVSSMVLCKLASILPFVGILIYTLTGIRKLFGFPVAGLFWFLVMTMPQISNYTVEIRMYSLALFFITALFVHSCEIVRNVKGNLSWLGFFLYGILTAYTQYYACVAVIAVYLALFVWFFIVEKKGIRKLLICAGLSVILYLPWLPSFISQVQKVSSSYWIQPLTWKSIFGCMKYVFLPISYATTKNYVLACLMIAVFGITFLHSILKKKQILENRYVLLCGIWIPVFTALIGFICSLLDRPIFVYRYLIPCLGAMWLVAAIVLWNVIERYWGLLLFVPFLMAGYSNMQGFYAEENKKLVQLEATESFLADFPEDAVVLCNFDHVQAVTACYLESSNTIYLYGSSPEELVAQLLPQCQAFENVEELSELVKTKDVYFFGSFNSREDLLKQWEQEGISYTEEGTYLLERYYFNVYRLSSNSSVE